MEFWAVALLQIINILRFTKMSLNIRVLPIAFHQDAKWFWLCWSLYTYQYSAFASVRLKNVCFILLILAALHFQFPRDEGLEYFKDDHRIDQNDTRPWNFGFSLGTSSCMPQSRGVEEKVGRRDGLWEESGSSRERKTNADRGATIGDGALCKRPDIWDSRSPTRRTRWVFTFLKDVYSTVCLTPATSRPYIHPHFEYDVAEYFGKIIAQLPHLKMDANHEFGWDFFFLH